MKTLKRWIITIAVLAIFAGILEVGLRIIVPSLIEAGSRIALRVPQSSEVTVDTRGSMLFNALRWRISDVTVTAQKTPLADDVSAQTKLHVGSMPLVPTFGSLQDGTATFTVSADSLDAMAGLVSGGLASHGEIRDGKLYGSGTLEDEQFDLPGDFTFEIPFSTAVQIDVEEGEISVTTSEVSVDDTGYVAEILAEKLNGVTRRVCVADRFPVGATLTGVDVQDSGEIVLHTRLDPKLLADPKMRSRGSCEETD